MVVLELGAARRRRRYQATSYTPGAEQVSNKPTPLGWLSFQSQCVCVSCFSRNNYFNSDVIRELDNDYVVVSMPGSMHRPEQHRIKYLDEMYGLVLLRLPPHLGSLCPAHELPPLFLVDRPLLAQDTLKVCMQWEVASRRWGRGEERKRGRGGERYSYSAARWVLPESVYSII